ncbi:hypothetical protein OGATHE_001052 [Ogataea polymorpha]|uniref:Uncharacterized protein n=1 Tax=Ogataea polymorpha TaxID=460523 RepID=A0A9P8TEG0_9ASCO|nr:hypothetical protein OGATHE_001052 [Ogataea polymorpha]
MQKRQRELSQPENQEHNHLGSGDICAGRKAVVEIHKAVAKNTAEADNKAHRAVISIDTEPHSSHKHTGQNKEPCKSRTKYTSGQNRVSNVVGRTGPSTGCNHQSGPEAGNKRSINDLTVIKSCRQHQGGPCVPCCDCERILKPDNKVVVHLPSSLLWRSRIQIMVGT